MAPRWITRDEAAELLGTDACEVDSMVTEGLIETKSQPGELPRYRLDDVESLAPITRADRAGQTAGEREPAVPAECLNRPLIPARTPAPIHTGLAARFGGRHAIPSRAVDQNIGLIP